jgi:hypothetical protein
LKVPGVEHDIDAILSHSHDNNTVRVRHAGRGGGRGAGVGLKGLERINYGGGFRAGQSAGSQQAVGEDRRVMKRHRVHNEHHRIGRGSPWVGGVCVRWCRLLVMDRGINERARRAQRLDITGNLRRGRCNHSARPFVVPIGMHRMSESGARKNNLKFTGLTHYFPVDPAV